MSLTNPSPEEKALWEKAAEIRKYIQSMSGQHALKKAMALLGEDLTEEKAIVMMITEILSKPRFDEIIISYQKYVGIDGYFLSKIRNDFFKGTEWKYALAKSFLFFREFVPIDQRITEIWAQEMFIRLQTEQE